MFDDIALSTMLATAVIFLAVIFILNVLLYKPLLKFMDERAVSIDNDEKKVKDNFEEMTNFGEELAKIKQDTRDEINTIKQKATAQARSLADEEIQKKKDELEQKMQAFTTQLLQEKNELEHELKLRLPLWQESLQKKLKELYYKGK